LVVPGESAPGFGKTYARTVSRYRAEEAHFRVAPLAALSGRGSTLAPAWCRVGAKAIP